MNIASRMKPRRISETLRLAHGLNFVVAAWICLSQLLCATLAAQPVKIIFDTDIGSDCDDAGALAEMHALADLGEVEPLGVIYSSGRNRYGVGVCDAINTWYGRGDLPLGQYQGSDVGDTRDDYPSRIATATNLYGHDIVSSAPELVTAYKQMLRDQPDDSVTIVTVGHPHGLVHLLRDAEGARLVQAKVRRWFAQGGANSQPEAGWNFSHCGADAYLAELLEKWPKDAYFVIDGPESLTGHRKLPLAPERNPVREIYRLWNKQGCLQQGRPSWDQFTLLAAVRPQYFKVENYGCVQCTSDGKSFWNPASDNPRHHRVRRKIPAEELAVIIEDLMVKPPRLPRAPAK